MATQFEIECALMAGASYYDTRAEINRFPIPDGWAKITDPDSHFSDSSSGFEAISFQRGDEIVISFAGTNPNSLLDPDNAANSGLATGFGSVQLLQAAEYFLQIKAQVTAANPNATITLTGHSLGGGLAALVGVFFGVKAVTFDQAPFANSAEAGTLFHPDVAANLKSDLLLAGYSEDDLDDLTSYLQLREVEGGIPNSELVTNIRVDGEFVSSLPTNIVFDTIGTTETVDHGPYSDPSSDMHSMALLTAFLQSGQSATNGQSLSEVTKKLTGLLGMSFEEQLFAHSTDPNSTEVNFLEHLIRHQEGTDPTVPNDGDDMLTRFTADMWKIAQDGGLSLSDTNIAKALTAFAMQAYYGNRLAADETLFESVGGGIRFNRADVADTLADVKGYTGTDMDKMFTAYLESLHFDTEGAKTAMIERLPDLLDWHIQAGSKGMTAMAGDERAFMLGGSGIDHLIGGSRADVLVGNQGRDILFGGDGDDVLLVGWKSDGSTDSEGDVLNGEAGNDELYGGYGADTLIGGADDDLLIGNSGIDTYYIEGNDTIQDSGRNSIYVMDENQQYQLLAGGFVQEEGTSIYRSLSDGTITLTFHSPGHLVLNGTDSVTFANQTSAADFANGDFGITLFDFVSADRVLTGTDDDDVTGAVALIGEARYYFSGTVSGVQPDDDLFPGWGEFTLTGDVPPNLNIDGGAGNDQLYGLAGSDSITGGSGNDVIFGEIEWVSEYPEEYPLLNPWGLTGMTDVLRGESGKDVIIAGFGDDAVSGGDDDDFLEGGDGNDTVGGDGGNDVVTGSNGDDSLFGGDGNDLLYGDSVLAFTSWFIPGDIVSFTFQMSFAAKGYVTSVLLENFDVLHNAPEPGDDLLYGGAGNDLLDGGAGNDTLLGGDDHDTLIGGIGDESLDGGAGNDWLVGDNGDLTGAGNDILAGGDGDDLLQGLGGNDTLRGDAGYDELYGFDGNDTLDGGADNDYLNGGTGDDTYVFGIGSGQDSLYETDGADTIRVFDALSGAITVTRDQYNIFLGVNNTADRLKINGWFNGNAYRVEEVLFSDGTTWDGAALEARITAAPGTSGDDVLYGGIGDDTYFFTPGGGTDIIQPDPGGYDTVVMGMEYDPASLSLYESGEDMIMRSSDGTQFTFIDWFTASEHPIELFTFSDGIQRTSEELLAEIPMWRLTIGSGGNDMLYGDDGDDQLEGGLGNDYLFGGAGDDILIGGAGCDYLYGGLGNDLYLVAPGLSSAIISDYYDDDIDPANYQGDIDIVRFTDDTLPSDVHLTWDGSTWNGGALTLRIGDNGNEVELDISYAGGGWWYYGNFDGRSTAGIEQLEFSDGTVWKTTDLLARLMDGTEGADELYGTSGDDTITGHGGNDWLEGFAGDDLMDGGDGNDVLRGGIGSDTIMGGAGDDFLYGNWQDTVGVGEENNTLMGGDGNDVLYGDWGNDIMSGGAGNDALNGGEGNDLYLFNPGDEQDIIYNGNYDDEGRIDWQNPDIIRFGAGITVSDIAINRDGDDLVLAISTTGDSLSLGGWFESVYAAPARGEQLEFADGTVWDVSDLADRAAVLGGPIFVGTEGDDILASAGDWSDDILLGKGGSDLLNGGDQCDWLDGGDGDDVLDGGSGEDLLNGGAGNDILAGGEGDDTYIFNAGDGVDRIVDSGGTDTIQFGAGITSDSLSLDLGSLLVRVGDLGDAIHIADFNPDDPFNSSVIETFRFADGTVLAIADLLQRGFDIRGSAGDDWLTGTALNDRITGEAGADTLDGSGGDDLLAGGLGNDTLLGAAGDDRYIFQPGAGNDRIEDAQGQNTLYVGSGLTACNLEAERLGDDMSVQIPGAAGSFVLVDWFTQGGEGVNYIEFDNGTVLDRAGIEMLLNRPPVVNADQITVYEDSGLLTLPASYLLANDTDPNPTDVLSLIAVGDSGVGAAVTLAEGQISYDIGPGFQRLAEGEILQDSFAYTVSDSKGSTAQGLVLVDIAGGNDAPVAAGDTNATMEDAILTISGNVLLNDFDIDNGTVLNVAEPGELQGSYGTLGLAADGSYIYRLNNESSVVQSLGREAMVSERFSYSATDGMESGSSALEITLAGSNDAPILVAPLADQQVRFNKNFSWQLPAGSFADPDQGDTMDFTATLSDGSALPAWLSFDAASQTFSGRAPRKIGSLEVMVTATDRVSGNGNTAGSLSASDVFLVTISHGNHGAGIGEDTPPPGQNDNANDGPVTAPGNSGRRGGSHQNYHPNRAGNGERQRFNHGDEARFRLSNNSKAGQEAQDDGPWRQLQSEPQYLNASHWDEKREPEMARGGASVDPAVIFGRWLSMDLAASKTLAEKKTLSWLDERLGADTTALAKESAGFLGSTAIFGLDPFSLQVGHGQELQGFKGLGEGIRKVA